jgi:cytoskeletal protein RodZ
MENFESIGVYLKSLRIQKDLTLSDLSEKTKIKIKQLSEIEEDNFSNLGGKGYARATIITYARALGADIDLIIQEFDLIYENQEVKIYKSTSSKSKKYLISTNFFSIMLIIVLIIAIVIVAVKFYKEGKFVTPFYENKNLQEEKVEEPDSVSLTPEVLIDTTEITKEKIFNQEALHDSTDYTAKLIFQDKESPFHIKR